MRDLVAGIIAVGLLLLAASLSTALTFFRRRRLQARAAEYARGRTVIAEIPAAEDLLLVSEDPDAFHYGDTLIPKDSIVAARVLINGSPSPRSCRPLSRRRGAASDDLRDRPEGIARDRWDVAVEMTQGMVLIECGAIRERVSQELARAIFDAIKRDVERRNT